MRLQGDTKMRVLILGANGMLGHKAYQVFKPIFDTWATVRSTKENFKSLPFFDLSRVIDKIEVGNFESVKRALDLAEPHVVLNSIGVVKQLREAERPTTAITINALFPHLLNELCERSGTRLISISTDCVFSGKKGGYTEDDQPDAYDLYGRTKVLGEVAGKNSLTLRTSMIGREIWRGVGLVEWFIGQKGQKVQGFKNAIFSGFTTKVLAGILARVIQDYPRLAGLYHVSSEPISKFDLLCEIRDAMGLNIEIEPDIDFSCDRSLNSGKFRALTGFRPPSWKTMVEELAIEAPEYEAWRKSLKNRERL